MQNRPLVGRHHLRLAITLVLAAALGADMNTTDGKAVFWKAMSTASKQLHVDLNPRYGAWDVQKSSRVDAKTPWLREVTSAGTQQTT